MAQETTETAADAVARFLVSSCEASGVPLTVEDPDTLLDVAQKLNGA